MSGTHYPNVCAQFFLNIKKDYEIKFKHPLNKEKLFSF